MSHVTAATLQRNFGEYRAIAMREPVTITNHGREDLVMLSVAEYRRLKQYEERAFHASQISQEELEDLDNMIIPDEASHYDNEMDQ